MRAVSNRQVGSLKQLHEATELLGQRCVAFHPRLVQLTGRVTAGLLLSQALYWSRKLALSEPARQGWFWKTREDWRNETGLSRREQDYSRRILKDLGLWQERRVGMPAKMWYRIDLDALGRLLEPEAFEGWDWRNDRALLQLLGRPFLFYRTLSDVTGAATSAVLLSNLLGYERGRLKGGESLAGWRQYQFDILHQQTGLSRHEMIGARKALREVELIAERCLGMPPKVEWQVNLGRLIGLLSAGNRRSAADDLELRQPDNSAGSQATTQFSENVPSCLPESGKQDCWNPANKIAENRQTGNPETRQLDFRKRTNRKSGNAPSSWADSGQSDGRNPENLYVCRTTGLSTTTPTPPTPSPQPAAHPIPPDGRRWFDQLVWPKALLPEERPWVIKVLADVPEQAQLLLDELAGQTANGSKVIATPVNYLSKLASKARDGSFVPAAALREQARRQRIENERRVRVDPTPVPAADQEVEARKRQEGLAMLRGFMAQRMGQRRAPQ